MLLNYMSILSVFLQVLTVHSQQCLQGCKCSSKVTICAFTQISGIPTNLPTAITALTISGSVSSPNSFGHLSPSAFSFSRMSHLIMRYCGIDAIDAGAFRTLPELKRLNLEFNRIKTFTQQSFQGLSKLTSLDLTGNKNCDIRSNAFNGLSTLLDLRLGEMDLDRLDLNLFKSLHSLVTLDLHGNKFKTLDWTVISSLTNLKHVDLSGNQLTTIPSNVSSLFTQIVTKKGSIHLGNNPWKCNWEIKWLKNMSVSFSSVFSIGNIICDSPANLQYISLISVPDPKLEPILPKILYCDKTTVTVNEE
ncbi:leucine-rich repeat-containing protein 15-like [Mytilus trossulus]|uniref:leucine-rich repeat-containing protein 15-like n=1 Tax=Mytilus trossulus TaxID=6551 RepID=UPI0030046A91